MKIICNGIELADAAQKVSKALAAKSINQILEGMKIEAADDCLKITATDLDFSIEKTVDADVLEEGCVVVPGRIFAEYLSKTDSEEVELNSIDEKTLLIKFTDSECKIQCADAEDFPRTEQQTAGDSFIIMEEEFGDIINKVIFAVSSDDARPTLKGVLLEVEDYTLTAVALDGYRLALCKKPLEQRHEKPLKAIVPATALAELKKLLGGGESVLEACVEANNIVFKLEKTVVTTRLLAGDFIAYKQLMPPAFQTTLVASRPAFEKAIARTSVFSRSERNNLVRFEIKENLLSVSTSSEIGNAKDTVGINLSGKDLHIAFNSRYISDCLRALTNENVKFNFVGATGPCIITPAESDDCMYYVLPVRME